MTEIVKQLLKDYSEERIKYCVEACYGVSDPKALISMSNELLEALELALKITDETCSSSLEAREKIEAIIAKAREKL